MATVKAIDQPTVLVHACLPDGTLAQEVSILTGASYQQRRNQVGSFEVSIPLVRENLELLGKMEAGWGIEFWANRSNLNYTPSQESRYLYGGYITKLTWKTDGRQTVRVVSGPSYLGLLNQRKLLGGTGSQPFKASVVANQALPGFIPEVSSLFIVAIEGGSGAYDLLGLAPTGDSQRTISRFRVANDSAGLVSDIRDGALFGTAQDVELTAFLSGTETLDYLTKVFQERGAEPAYTALKDDVSSDYYGYPRLTYDIIRYTGPPGFSPPATAWDTGEIYFIVRVPGFGTNRAVGGPSDRPIIFDVAAGGITSAEHVVDTTDVRNFVWVLAGGEGATRARYEYSDPASIVKYGRQEDVIDAGQETNLNVLEQKARDFLDERKNGKEAIKMVVGDLPDQMFGVDYFFDDVVTVYWEEIGLVLNDFVSAVNLTMGGASGGGLGIHRTEITVGSEKATMNDGQALGRYLTGVKRATTNLRI